MLSFLVLLIQITIITSSTHLKSFGFTTSNETPEIDELITATLWFNYTIFSCDIKQSHKVNTYSCNSYEWRSVIYTAHTTAWTVSSPSNPECIGPQYALLIDNSRNKEPLIIDTVEFTDTTDTIYSANQFCISNTLHTTSAPITNTTTCGDTYTAHSTICINNDGKQIVYLDINKPNEMINNAVVSDATFISTQPIIDCTDDPTNEPTLIPTKHPTRFPSIQTKSPTIYPTIEPTHFPTIRPTHFPSLDPTHSPTMEPTHFPTIEPTHSSMEPTYAPSLNSTRFATNDPTIEPTSFGFNSSRRTEGVTDLRTELPSLSPLQMISHDPTLNLTDNPTELMTTDIDEKKWTELLKFSECIVYISISVVVFVCIVCIVIICCIKYAKQTTRKRGDYYKKLNDIKENDRFYIGKTANIKDVNDRSDDDDIVGAYSL